MFAKKLELTRVEKGVLFCMGKAESRFRFSNGFVIQTENRHMNSLVWWARAQISVWCLLAERGKTPYVVAAIIKFIRRWWRDIFVDFVLPQGPATKVQSASLTRSWLLSTFDEAWFVVCGKATCRIKLWESVRFRHDLKRLLVTVSESMDRRVLRGWVPSVVEWALVNI